MTTTLAVSELATRHWTREEYERAVAEGEFGPDDRVELIEGVIALKMPQNPPHATALTSKALRPAFPHGHVFRPRLPLSVGVASQPEPDLAIVSGSPRDYRGTQPAAEKTALVVEISDGSLAYDQTEKAVMYARGGIGDHWIVNLSARLLEVRRGPTPDGYLGTTALGESEAVAPPAALDFPAAVADLLP